MSGWISRPDRWRSNTSTTRHGSTSMRMTGRRRELLELATSQAVSLGASLGITLGTAGILGPEGRGELAFVIGSANVAGSLAFASLHVGAVGAHKRGDPSAVARTIRLGILAAAASVVVGGLLGLFAYLGVISRISATDIWFATLGTALVSFNLVVLRIIQGLGDARGFRISWTIQSVLYAGLGILAAAIERSATAVLLSWFFGLILSTAYAYRQLPRRIHGPDRTTTLDLLKTSLSSHVGVSGTQMLYRIDVVVLGLFASRSQVGIYSIAVPIASMTWLASEALSLSAFSNYDPQESLSGGAARIGSFLRINFLMSVVGSAFLLIGGAIAINTLLPAYRDAIPLIAILIPGVIVQGGARILLAHLAANGSRRETMQIGAASFILSLLYVPLCDIWQSTGAAVASTIIYVVHGAVVAHLFRRQYSRTGKFSSA